jgi:hypothetical protein
MSRTPKARRIRKLLGSTRPENLKISFKIPGSISKLEFPTNAINGRIDSKLIISKIAIKITSA